MSVCKLGDQQDGILRPAAYHALVPVAHGGAFLQATAYVFHLLPHELLVRRIQRGSACLRRSWEEKCLQPYNGPQRGIRYLRASCIEKPLNKKASVNSVDWQSRRAEILAYIARLSTS